MFLQDCDTLEDFV